MMGKGHPLPGSDEARHSEIPEHAEIEKGRGEDSAPRIQPDGAVNPDGEPYRYDDLGRGTDLTEDDLEKDQAAHQDRGQGIATAESGQD